MIQIIVSLQNPPRHAAFDSLTVTWLHLSFGKPSTKHNMALTDPYAGRPADALKDEGNKMFSAGHFKEAVDLYTKAIEIDPNNKVLFSNRSFANLRLVRMRTSRAPKLCNASPSFTLGF